MKLSDKQEILQVMHGFAQNVQEQFDAMNVKFDTRLNRVEALIVTKDYLDDKLADRDGAFIALLKKEGIKDEALYYMLSTKKILSIREKEELMSLSAFKR